MTTFNVYIQKATIDNYERMRDDFSKHFHDCKLINSKHLLANMVRLFFEHKISSIGFFSVFGLFQ